MRDLSPPPMCLFTQSFIYIGMNSYLFYTLDCDLMLLYLFAQIVPVLAHGSFQLDPLFLSLWVIIYLFLSTSLVSGPHWF